MATETYRVNGVAVTKYMPATQKQKTPVVMVHGGNHAGWCWETWAQFFAEAGYEVHVPDWYNHGASDALLDEEFLHRSIADVAKKEIPYITERFDQPPILIGHSMGGLAAALYATTAPVERLAMVATVMPQSAHPDPIPLPVDMNKPYPLFPFEQAKQIFFTKSSEADARRYYERLSVESPQAVYEATHWSVELDPADVTVPTLVMATEFDQLIPHEPLKRYAEMLHADYIQASGVGHSDVLLKSPEAETAAQQVIDWLAK